MGSNKKSLRILLLSISIVLVLVIAVEVFGAGLWFLDPTPFPTDYPFPKRTIQEALNQTQASALQSPTPPPGGAIIGMGPTPDPIQLGLPPGTPMGDGVLTDGAGMHISQYTGSFYGNQLVWVTETEIGEIILVYAGVDANDQEQGLIYVVRKGTIWDGIGEKFILPTRSGKPTIADAVGGRLVIETEGGDIFYFDVPASKFAVSLTDPLPTRTPGPTLTPRITPTPISGDDVSNNPASAGLFPLNTDLRYKINPSGDQDWFVFAVHNTDPLQVSLKDLPEPYQMNVIYAEVPINIGSSTEPDTNDKFLLIDDVDPGFYYVLIEGISGSSNIDEQYTLRLSDYQLEWLPPLGGNDPYTGIIGGLIPVVFTVHRFSGDMLMDETVQLSLLDANGSLVMGPYGYSSDPNEGILIDPPGIYHCDLVPGELQPGTYTLLVTFEEIGGENTLDISLAENQAPLVNIGGEETLNEGEILNRTGNFLDPDSTSWTGLVDYGLGEGYSPLVVQLDNTFILSQTYTDDGLYTITVQITDDLERTGEASIDLTVNNVPPSVSLDGDPSLDEGMTFTGNGSFIDPGEDTWAATVDYGGGSGPEPLALTDHGFDLEFIYPEDGSYSITVCVADDDGGEGCAIHNLIVANLPPIVDAGPDQTTEIGQQVTFSGSYSDPGILDTHTISWDFGDGNAADGILVPSHIYDTPGNYTVTLTVTDDEGASASDSLIVEVTQLPSGEVITLLDRRTDNCLTLDLETGAYTWKTDSGLEYNGEAKLVERGNILLIRSSAGEDVYLRGILIIRNEFGTARLRTGTWFRGDWYFIVDRDFSDPPVCP